MYAADGKSMLLGAPLTLGSADVRDLQRNAAGRALLGDPRNDENVIVSQFQGLFLRFHNRVVRDNPDLDFEAVQDVVRSHYQHVVLYDFLTRIVSRPVLDLLRTDGDYDAAKIASFPISSQPFMPVEFAAAAYRLGHSMVRPGYRLNDATLLPIFPLPADVEPGFPEGLTGFRAMTQDWGIDWGRFIDVDVRDYGVNPDDLDPDPAKQALQNIQNFRRLQFAYRIDTALVDPLGSLPISVSGNVPLSLALRNLLRGVQFGLPSGQAVADAMEIGALHDEEILIGQGVDKPGKLPSIVEAAGQVFAGNCPLWVYVLAEAMRSGLNPGPRLPVTQAVSVTTPQLGPVGGRIVAEVFLGLMFSDPFSILNRDIPWTPESGPDYKLKDFVRYALG